MNDHLEDIRRSLKKCLKLTSYTCYVKKLKHKTYIIIKRIHSTLCSEFNTNNFALYKEFQIPAVKFKIGNLDLK